MKTEILKAKEYLYSIYSKAPPEVREKAYWTYKHFVFCMKHNYEKTNDKLLTSIVIKHHEDMREY